jgi:hypothetical protein
MSTGKNWILDQIAGYIEDIVSCFTEPFKDINEAEEPDPPDKDLYMKAMELGIDPATIPPGKLRQVIADEIAKIST